jgi:hypothetical protein
MRSNDIEAHRRAILEFGGTFKELLENMKPVQADSFLTSFPKWIPLPGCEARVAELNGKLSGLTGPAAEAMSIAGVFVDYKPSGTWQTVPINPVTAWPTILTDDPMIDANLIVHSCNVALGNLATSATRARSAERSLAGFVGRFVSFPRRVREAAGLPPNSVGGQLAFGAGVLVQIFVAVVGTVVGGILLAWVIKSLGLGG